MMHILDRELPRIEASIRNDNIMNHNSQKHSENKNYRNTNRFYTNHPINHEDSDTGHVLCWFHKSNNHVSNKCRDLWKLDGKQVSNLARKNNICTFCGKNAHKPCPNSQKLKCKTPGCNLSHHALFLLQQKGKKAG